MANYHPNAELLMQFAAGQLDNALGIIVACHIQQCHHCRNQMHTYERLGGELLESMWVKSDDNIQVSEDLLNRTIARLSEKQEQLTDRDQVSKPALANVPKPLRRFMPDDFDNLPWYGFSSNIKQYDINFGDDNQYVGRFYKIKAGKELPQHTHRGNEFTLVMSGAFSDEAGSYHSGDFILADEQTHHSPRAHEDMDCICFAVMDAPLKLTGFWGSLINPFLR